VAAIEPLTIFVGMLAWFVLAGGAVWWFRHKVTRKCPLCEAKVELGRAQCQVCGYRFSTARYYR
jgi:hypothetical protein